ncbi:MAG TPA: metallophosphoesterase [Anaeromyxobacteraceae bacterium]|nr:metallophosphoesterase [Anaeromyxobacteraceae bacterium]
MTTKTLAHVSDLHLGLAPAAERGAAALCDALLRCGVDHVLVTGDLTEKGRRAELDQFRRAFEPLLEAGRVTMVPGNHDRAGDDVAGEIMPGRRVQAEERDGLYLVSLDSTAAHNRSLLTSHGHVDQADVEAVAAALDDAPPGALRVLGLHHHLTPLPGDFLHESLASWLGIVWCDELAAGEALLTRIRGRCDLVLHGHRHVPRQSVAFGAMPIYNAGASTQLGRVRIFSHRAGALEGGPRWLSMVSPRLASRAAAVAAAA